MGRINKKAQFLTIDALIALTIIIIAITIIVPVLKEPKIETTVSSDILQSLSSLKIGEMNSAYVATLNITDMNKSVIDQIGEFYITNISLARDLSSRVLSSISPTENIGIWYGDQLLASRNITPIETAENVFTDRQVISGIGGNGTGVTGFSARAFLSSSERTEYFYFGGYVGEGNISTLINYKGIISTASVELAISDNFNIYVNGTKDPTDFNGSVNDSTPVSYSLDTSGFSSGSNLLEIKGDNLHIAGGFVKITYDSDVSYEQPERYCFPGIEGIINLYDGFYVPGNLTGLTISLRFNNTVDTFLAIGDTWVFNGSSNGTVVTITNNTLSSLLDYNDLSKKTIPLRFGMENVSFLGGITRGADIFSVTDLSGSMGWGCSSACKADYTTCTDPLCGISSAKQASVILIDTMLNHSENRIGLVGYESSAKDSDYHKLTTVNDSLVNIIDSQWDASGGTCICCGINKAVVGFIDIYPSLLGEIISSRVSSSSDDAEELISDGDMEGASSDLELTDDSNWHGGNQEVGMRFQNIDIPQGVVITNAYIEFETDETSSTTTHITFSAEDIDNAATFSTSDYDITSRTKTSAKVTWSNVPAWSSVSEKHVTPDLSQVIQEVTDRPGWISGNSIAIIVNGSGRRIAESYNGESDNAPLLVITYIPADCGDGDIDPGEECDDGNPNNNDNCTNVCTLSTCGDGIIWDEQDGNETCDNAGLCTGDDLTTCNLNSDCSVAGGVCEVREYDGCDLECQTVDKMDVIIVMSDGDATYECAEQGNTPDLNGNGISDEPEDDAIQAACDAYNDHGIKVYSIGFGSNADSVTLQAIAACGDGSYYSTVDDLVYIYEQIANELIETIFYEQTVEVVGNFFSQLHPDSYIEFEYEKEESPVGLVITLEEQFSTTTGVNFSLPENSIPLEATVISYSGPKWTSFVSINNTNIYNLSSYQADFLKLGDPYSVNIPVSNIQENNTLSLEVGLSPTNTSNGSIHNKVIYTIRKDLASYTSVSTTAEGCNWSVELPSGIITTKIPTDYSGSALCVYTSANESCDGYDCATESTDAVQIAVYNIFKLLDFNSDGVLDVELASDTMQISSSSLEGVPFHYSTEAQVRKWY